MGNSGFLASLGMTIHVIALIEREVKNFCRHKSQRYIGEYYVVGALAAGPQSDRTIS